MTNKVWPKQTIQSISKSGGRFIIKILPPIVVADMNCRSILKEDLFDKASNIISQEIVQ